MNPLGTPPYIGAPPYFPSQVQPEPAPYKTEPVVPVTQVWFCIVMVAVLASVAWSWR